MGYSWVDEHTPQSANQGHGAGLAGRRALLVIIGKPPFPSLPPPCPLPLAIFQFKQPSCHVSTYSERTNPTTIPFFQTNYICRRFHSRVHHDGLPSAQLCPSPLPPPSRQEHVGYRRSLWESGDKYRERSGCCRMG